MNAEKLKKSLSKIRYIHNRNAEGEVNLNIFFEAILKNEPLEINKAHMESILINDLGIKTQLLNRKLVNVLCEALVYYMSAWPGWQRNSEYRGGNLQLKEWMQRFRQYLIFKSNFIVKNSHKFCKEKANVCNRGTQTDESIIRKVLAPYTLVIGGPPNFINNIACNGHNGNIIIMQHPAKPWKKLHLTQFLNWPNVSVHVTLPDISLTRSNIHQTHRFITLTGDSIPFPEVRHITHITKLSSDKEFKPYSHLFFVHYFHQFTSLLQKLTMVKQRRLLELTTIFGEFLKDIREIGVYNVTMSSDASVGFNIGKCKYNRTKRICSMPEAASQNAINYSEIVVPQVDISLHYFNAVQDHNTCSDDITFESLNFLLKQLEQLSNMEQFIVMINSSCITYKCLQCDTVHRGPDAYNLAVAHFYDSHKSEQTVVCSKCNKEFEIEVLSNSRWSHKCGPV